MHRILPISPNPDRGSGVARDRGDRMRAPAVLPAVPALDPHFLFAG